MNSPCMYEPSLGPAVNSSLTIFLVTSHTRHILSRGRSFFRAVLWVVVASPGSLLQPQNYTYLHNGGQEGLWVEEAG